LPFHNNPRNKSLVLTADAWFLVSPSGGARVPEKQLLRYAAGKIITRF
jgi:hypothetical protein